MICQILHWRTHKILTFYHLYLCISDSTWSVWQRFSWIDYHECGLSNYSTIFLINYQMRFVFPSSLCNHHWNLQKRLSTVCQFTQGHYAIRHVDKHLRVDNTAFNGQFKTFPRLDWAQKSSFSETLFTPHTPLIHTSFTCSQNVICI